MADGLWIERGKFVDKHKAMIDNIYRANAEIPNVFVHADLDTVQFEHTANIQELIQRTVNARFGRIFSTSIIAYTSSTDLRLFAALRKTSIKVRPFDKRKMICGTCKQAREKLERGVVRKQKPKLLELEMLLSICLQVVDLATESNVPRQGAIWIISNDFFFKHEFFKNLKRRDVDVYSSIPVYMVSVPMFQDMIDD